jgi:hypothetical protein
MLVRGQQSLNLEAQFPLACARPVEESRALFNAQLQGGVCQLVYLLITFGRHTSLAELMSEIPMA